ncbi:unnamed protein product [Brassica napus]|nr:unnamed protein product [Brassica napus]
MDPIDKDPDPDNLKLSGYPIRPRPSEDAVERLLNGVSHLLEEVWLKAQKQPKVSNIQCDKKKKKRVKDTEIRPSEQDEEHMMSEGGAPSKYVKLTKEQAPVDEVNPGELNQPIQVPHLAVHKCNECGQALPENFEAPADEPWTTGIFGCTEDMSSFWQGLFCPSVLFGRVYETLSDEETSWTKACICHSIVVEGGLTVASIAACAPGIDPHTTFLMWEGLLFVWWMCGIYTGNVRQTLQRKYHLQNSPCDPCMVHCCLHFCAVCQEHREMKNRLSDNFVMPMTVVNPPPVQEMSASDDSVPVSHHGSELEMRPL